LVIVADGWHSVTIPIEHRRGWPPGPAYLGGTTDLWDDPRLVITITGKLDAVILTDP
jgi:hypothetical protein